MIEIKKIAVSKKSGATINNYNYNSISDGWRFAFSDDGQTISDNGKRFVGFYKGQKKPTEFDSYVWVKALPTVREVSANDTINNDDDVLLINANNLSLTTSGTPFDGRELIIKITNTNYSYTVDGTTYRSNQNLIWYNGQWH